MSGARTLKIEEPSTFAGIFDPQDPTRATPEWMGMLTDKLVDFNTRCIDEFKEFGFEPVVNGTYYELHGDKLMMVCNLRKP